MPYLKTVAITRPQDDAARMVAELEMQGIRGIGVPMLRIEPVAKARDEVAGALRHSIQAIAITSRHALSALHFAEAFSVPLYAVGKATALAAQKAGFVNVITSEETAQSLLDLLQKECSPAKGGILYVRGADITLDITAHLRVKGYEASEVIAYKAQPIEVLPEDYVQALQNGGIDEVWFFSERSAENYWQIVKKNGLVALHGAIICRCLSQKIAAQFGPDGWKLIAADLRAAG